MTAPTLALFLIYAICPPNPVALTFKNIAISQALSNAKLVGLKLDLPFKLEGRVAHMRAELRDHVAIVKITGVTLTADSTQEPIVRTLTMHYNRKTGYMVVHGEMFGGIMDITGVWK